MSPYCGRIVIINRCTKFVRYLQFPKLVFKHYKIFRKYAGIYRSCVAALLFTKV